MKTSLQIAHCAFDELGVRRVNSLTDLQDDTGTQLMALMNREVTELAEREGGVSGWPQLRKEWSLAVTAGVDNYALPADFSYLIANTGWNRSQLTTIEGGLTPPQWQDIKAWVAVPQFYTMFRLMAGRIYFAPAPPASTTYTFEYYSNGYVLDGSTLKSMFTKDTDTPVLPDSLIVLGAKWRWLRAKGLDYAEEKEMYEAAVIRAQARVSRAPILYLDSSYEDASAF